MNCRNLFLTGQTSIKLLLFNLFPVDGEISLFHNLIIGARLCAVGAYGSPAPLSALPIRRALIHVPARLCLRHTARQRLAMCKHIREASK